MKPYPKAQGLMAAWIRAQHERQDLVGELARAAIAPDSGAPVRGFRIVVWRKWALEHGLTNEHVEAVLSEYARATMTEKQVAYDWFTRAQRAQCV